MKLKLKPSATISRRYLLIEGAGKETIERAILDNAGALGWARASPMFVDIRKGNLEGKIILAIARGSLNEIKAALGMSKAGIKIIRVSGTLKGLEK
jgi:RNase P/RNase MRP subunit POP5